LRTATSTVDFGERIICDIEGSERARVKKGKEYRDCDLHNKFKDLLALNLK